MTPNFSDQRQRPSAPALSGLWRVRFLTSVDYPPFNFLDARGRLAGLNVELARAICEELEITDICQIEARPFEELLPALEAGEGEAIIAGLAVTAENRQALAFTEPYFRYPARFVASTELDLSASLAAGMSGRRVGVVQNTAHAAMLAAFFPAATATPLETRDAALTALRAGDVEAVFGDGVGLSFWLASEAAQGCCAFAGGPYLSDRFLGEGLAIAVRDENATLADAFDDAIVRLVEKRRFSELLLRAFPISAF
ncbi:transporter substrate-binding domain-containing protein [Aureimonas mangrovi]|uniref:transporter substrate-binding domain-containing protein n=1 Tax=Aureimonas mangrovi TaxID=2758041 RepID=UPI001FE67CCE|nr:transporter substrate-binding domain-containing protein [Aureimonas mangrovi]